MILESWYIRVLIKHDTSGKFFIRGTGVGTIDFFLFTYITYYELYISTYVVSVNYMETRLRRGIDKSF